MFLAIGNISSIGNKDRQAQFSLRTENIGGDLIIVLQSPVMERMKTEMPS